MNVSISVVIPNRNDARYLSACLKSVLSQRRQPDELIFVDDESTDESVSVARSLLSNCAVARIVENPKQLGTTGALNVGLKLARSKYVLFLSSNDFISPDLLARAESQLGSLPSVGVWSAMTWALDEQGHRWLYPSPVIARNDTFFPPEVCRKLSYRIGNWFTTMIFNREALLEIGGFDDSLIGLSDWFAALVLVDRYGAAFCPAPLRMWRVHDDSVLSRTLSTNHTIAAVVSRFQKKGVELAPELFTSRMLARMDLRINFASLRASRGITLPYARSRVGKLRGAAINVLGRVLSSRLRRLSLGIIFVILRPFDLIPLIWYRFLGSLVVRIRESLNVSFEKTEPAAQSS